MELPNLSTPFKVLFRSVPSSPSSPSTSQSPPPSSPFTAHIPFNHHSGSASPVTPVVPTVPIIQAVPINTPNPPNMANRYAPLRLPANPPALAQDYQTKISYFDSTGPYSAIQHAKRMQDHFENYEIDDDSVRMRILSKA